MRVLRQVRSIHRRAPAAARYGAWLLAAGCGAGGVGAEPSLDAAVPEVDAARALAPHMLGVADDPIEVASVAVGPVSGATTEAGGAATFQVVLDRAPRAPVTLSITSPDASEGVAAVTTLTFDPATWSTPHVVTVIGQDDAIDDGDALYQVTVGPPVSSDPAYAGLAPTPVAITNLDDDTSGFVIERVGEATSEVGDSVTFSVALTSEPSGPVELAVTSNDPTEGLPDVATLTFTAVDWQVPQVITVAGQPDDVDDGDVGYQVELTVTTGPTSYAAVAPVQIACTNTDDDVAALLVRSIGDRTSEPGGSVQVMVRLATVPAADVVIEVASDDPSEGVAAVSSLRFTAADWDVEQAVAVVGKDDLELDDVVAYHLSLGPAASADPGYLGLTASVDLRNLDDEQCGFVDDFDGATLAPGWTIGAEGGSTTTSTAASGPGSAIVSEASGNHQRGLRRQWVPCQPARVVVWIAPVANATGNYVLLGAPGSGPAVGNGVFAFVSAGRLRLVGSAGGHSYGVVPVDAWSKLEFHFNWETTTYDTYLNDAFVARTGLRDSSLTSIGQMDLYNFESTPGRWDGIAFTP